jgi:hypothetical protein
MIGSGPGGDGAGGGFGDGEFGVGNSSGATGFVGADDAATDAAGGPGGLPMGGSGGQGRDEAERHREAWMNEDADTWEGGAPQQVVPSQIGS